MSMLFARTAGVTGGRVVALAVLSLLFASVTYGFAASNTVNPGSAGEGAATITGYAVTNVKYNLNAANPSNIDSAQFSLTGTVKPSTVKARLVSGTGSWYDCSSASTASPYAYTCATTSPSQATTTVANELRVVAAD